MMNVQEQLACLTLALDPAAVLATEVRAHCRMAQGNYFGARKDFEMLAATGGNVAKVSLLQTSHVLHNTPQMRTHLLHMADWGVQMMCVFIL